MKMNCLTRIVLTMVLIGAYVFGPWTTDAAACPIELDAAWTATGGGAGEGTILDVAAVLGGGVCYVGSFSSVIDLDPTSGIDFHQSEGENDVFVTRLAADSSYLWSRSLGGEDNDLSRAVAVDPAGNVFVLGMFKLAVDFDPSPAFAWHLSRGGTDIFLTKYAPDGSYRWTQTFGGLEEDSATALAVDPQGNIYIAGTFLGRVDLDPGSGTDFRTSVDNTADFFVMRINADGTYGWTRTGGSTGAEVAAGIAFDTAGYVLVTGSFRGALDFDPSDGTDQRTPVGNPNLSDVFVTSYTSGGDYRWTRVFGGNGSDSSRSVRTDAAGNVILAGQFIDIVDFDFTQGTDRLGSNGAVNRFITKVTRDGGYGWTRATQAGVNALGVEAGGSVMYAGSFVDTHDFDPSTAMDNRTAQGGNDEYVSQLSPDGSYAWTRTIGSLNDDTATALAVSSDGVAFMSGAFGGIIDFDPSGGGDVRKPFSRQDFFLSKLVCNVQDTDSDGVMDSRDNCPEIPNTDQVDADTDGVGDACDRCPGANDRIDCNSNGNPDACDITSGQSFDCNSNRVPDECEVTGCPPPPGGCCLPAGGCLALTQQDCGQFPGSRWAGPYTLCADVGGQSVCPLGACCLPDGSCVEDSLPGACSSMNGTHRPGGVACALAACPPPTGACCLTNGTCVNVTQAECGLFAGATWAGALTACADVGGTPTCPLGACCLPSGQCSGGMLQSACTQQGGTFRGPASTCANANCPQPMGACCLANGSCVVLTNPNCAASPGSRWAGANTTCVDANSNGRADACENVRGDINGDGVANPGDIPPFIAVLLGTPQAPEHVGRSDVNTDGTVNGGDVAYLVSAISES